MERCVGCQAFCCLLQLHFSLSTLGKHRQRSCCTEHAHTLSALATNDLPVPSTLFMHFLCVNYHCLCLPSAPLLHSYGRPNNLTVLHLSLTHVAVPTGGLRQLKERVPGLPLTSQSAVVIQRVVDGSPAMEAGLESEDVLLSVAGEKAGVLTA